MGESQESEGRIESSESRLYREPDAPDGISQGMSAR